jgi:preprotein translocase subunit SecB
VNVPKRTATTVAVSSHFLPYAWHNQADAPIATLCDNPPPLWFAQVRANMGLLDEDEVMAEQQGANGQAVEAQGPNLTVQKIYLKDASFEAPGAPAIFQEEGQPRVDLNLTQKVQNFAPNLYDVVLSLTVTCKVGEKTAYLCEVHQAGVFGCAGFDAGQLDAVLGTYCPNVLFPYARQVISDLVQNGGFPPFFMQPINFDQIYAETQKRRQEAA